MVNINNFLDIWDLFVNELVGSVWLFIFLGIVVISYFAVKSKLPTEVIILLNILFVSIVYMGSRGSLLILWVFVVFGVGILFYYFYQKTIRQG